MQAVRMPVPPVNRGRPAREMPVPPVCTGQLAHSTVRPLGQGGCAALTGVSFGRLSWNTVSDVNY